MNLNEPFVITVSREIGSGGHTVGRILAQKLGTFYFDKHLIESLTKKFNLTVSAIEKLKGEKKNWLVEMLHSLAPVPSAEKLDVDARYSQEFRINVTPDDIYEAEKEILKELADEGSCVIAGRSGFHILKDHPNHLHVFITASDSYRSVGQLPHPARHGEAVPPGSIGQSPHREHRRSPRKLHKASHRHQPL